MSKIGDYPTDSSPLPDDKLIGTNEDSNDATKNYSIQSILDLGRDQGDLRLISPNGTVWQLEISNVGVISATEV